MTSNVTEGELWKIKWNVTFPGADNIESVIITYKEVNETTTMLATSYQKFWSRAEIRTDLIFFSVVKKKTRKKLFDCKMCNLATENTKRNCKLSVAMLVKITFCNRFNFSGFTFSVFSGFAFFGFSVLEISSE